MPAAEGAAHTQVTSSVEADGVDAIVCLIGYFDDDDLVQVDTSRLRWRPGRLLLQHDVS
jgi:hypothetical protein